MKSFIYILSFFVLFAVGCNSVSNSKQDNNTKNVLVRKSIFGDTTLISKDFINQVDINNLSYDELNMLSYFPYATHNCLFQNKIIYDFYKEHTDWYLNEPQDTLYEKDVKLTEAEKEFIKNVDSLLSEKARNRYTSEGMLNPATSVNYYILENKDQKIEQTLQKYNIAIEETEFSKLTQIYEDNKSKKIPNFITTDLFIHFFHNYLSYITNHVETQYLYAEIDKMAKSLYEEAMLTAKNTNNEELKEIAEFNATFFAIAIKLIKDERVNIPEQFKSQYEKEIENIKKRVDAKSGLLLGDKVISYSKIKNQENYKEDETLMRYKQTIKWLSLIEFNTENERDIKRMAVMAKIFSNSTTEAKNVYQNILNIIAFFKGKATSLNLLEIEKTTAEIKDYESLISTQNINTIKDKIAKIVSLNGYNNTFSFSPQRYKYDNDIVRILSEQSIPSDISFPQGTDIMAFLGSEIAQKYSCLKDITSQKNTTSQEIKEGEKSIKHEWISALVNLQNHSSNEAWKAKNLSSALASWTALRNGRIYAKNITLGDTAMKRKLGNPIICGYIEPNVAFYKKIKEIFQLSKDKLGECGFLYNEIITINETIDRILNLSIKISEKETKGIPLSADDYYAIEYISNIISEGCEVLNIATICKDKKANQIYSAIGNANALYVVVEIEGKNHLMRGATYSYYDYVQKKDAKFITNKEWIEMVKNNKFFTTPQWMDSLLIKK